MLLSGSFLGISSLVFPEIQHRVRDPMWCCAWQNWIFWWEKIFLPPKWGKWTKNSFFFNISENLDIKFFWVWSVMTVYINCCILAQILNLGKIWYLKYGTKCSRSIRLQDFWVDWKILGWAWPRWSQDSKIGWISRRN